MKNREQILKWVRSCNYIEELSEYLKLPSRSKNHDEVKIAGEFAKNLLSQLELVVESYPTKGNPVIVAHNYLKPDHPTILIYGHYDVQPEGDHHLWDTPPFQPTVVDRKLFCRGSADNKGQHYAHILALKYLKQHHPEVFEKLNIKFILDGDEELGSFSLPAFVRANKELLEADFVLVSDGPSLVEDAPTIVGGVRGIISFQITINYNNTDLHSGNFGGVARSATLDLYRLLTTMIDNRGRILINNFYDQVAQPSEVEQQALINLDKIYNSIINNRNIRPAIKDDLQSHPFLNQAWPTFNINGIQAGGVQDNRRTIIPSTAQLSIDCRLVPNQNPQVIKELIQTHISSWIEQEGIEDHVEIEFDGTMSPSASPFNTSYLPLIQEAATFGFGKKPVLVPRLGGSLPIQLFPELLKIPVFLFPYALPDENNHSPNENLDLDYFESGVISTVYLLHSMAKTKSI